MNIGNITKKLIKLELVMKLYSRSKLNDLGLHFGQMGIMGYIHDNPGCTQVDVAQNLSVSPASIALSTKRLEKSGFILKTTDEDNLRCKRLELTEKGLNAAQAAMSIRKAQDVIMFSGFTEEELALLDKFIDRITLNMTNEKENIVSRKIVHDLVKRVEDLD